MTTQQTVEALIEQAAELPDDAQAELLQSLIEMRANILGVDDFDDADKSVADATVASDAG